MSKNRKKCLKNEERVGKRGFGWDFIGDIHILA